MTAGMEPAVWSHRTALRGLFACAGTGVCDSLPGLPQLTQTRVRLPLLDVGSAFTTRDCRSDALWSLYTRGPAGGFKPRSIRAEPPPRIGHLRPSLWVALSDVT